ncbi:nucleoside monophosphate kinase [Candidatus Nomurabacteria bacterium]|nr:nucleoside monophosphate kinase [Candidatus Nomurabacteria bacterium]
MKKERLGFHLVLLGQIASGKDTQASLLEKKYNFSLVESGKYWRKLEKEDSPDGEWLRRTTRLGKPAPVVLMKKFLLENIEHRPKDKDLLFVGNPRLKPEAQLLKKILNEKKENFFALYITLPDKVIYSRSLRSDRYDDNKININRRIKWHKEQVSKSVNYFDSLGKLKKINGNQSIEKVHEDIEKALDYFKKLNNK